MPATDLRRLYRSEKDRMVAGVCAGVGEYFRVDPTIVRVVWCALTLLTALVGGALLYLACWILIPTESSVR